MTTSPASRAAADRAQPAYVSPGMPPLQLGKTRSFFEFWPTAVVYLPVVLQWLLLSLRYRSLTLPLLANPRLPLSGMVGTGKSLLLQQAEGALKTTILPWFTVTRDDRPLSQQIDDIEQRCAPLGIVYPLVCKPDIGCRGAGVKRVTDRQQLSDCLAHYPPGAAMMVQRLADYEAEVGLFYTRLPNADRGQILSMAFKSMPYVVGDGQRTLAELVAADPRAGSLIHLYQPRHQANWQRVIAHGEPYRLVFSASHCRGAIFKDGQALITPELASALDRLLHDLPEFHYGRLDIKFRDLASLQAGKTLQIVEINTASSESLHIWDSNTPWYIALRDLLRQYRLLFAMGAQNRARGHRPPRLRALLKAWRLERRLTRHYPETD